MGLVGNVLIGWEAGRSFHSHFPSWESHRLRGSLWHWAMLPLRRGDMGKVKLSFLTLSNASIHGHFCLNEAIGFPHWTPDFLQGYSHPQIVVRIDVSMGNMKVGTSFSAILPMSPTQCLIRIISSFISRKSTEETMKPKVGKTSKYTGSFGAGS